MELQLKELEAICFVLNSTPYIKREVIVEFMSAKNKLEKVLKQKQDNVNQVIKNAENDLTTKLD